MTTVAIIFPTKRLARTMLLSLFSLVVGACSGGLEETPTNVELTRVFQRVFADRQQANQAPPVLTRGILDGLDGEFLRVTVLDRQQSGFLYVQSERRLGSKGTVRVWRAEDDVTLAIQQGVLVQTRGLGNDLLASSVAISSSGLGPRTGGERRMTFDAFDNKTATLSAACSVTDLGGERIVIVERAYSTRHVREICEFSKGQIQNDYWIDSAAGIIWKSRQWAGPATGYLEIEQLTR